ncbi:uncharacterized protein Z518_08255 [Rhinocladiella mackenziei CBS 650.93]|uniref:Uncharacterized protein n=1 Tax=Rhinocladiella mackenziei CBS 650.93 TaxID=1442369 RepID=A0A0D2I8Z7_9EURO|nr:uncharacterized protein Z518_08255 [Rhinocladiella mackenziei CBS 650.93]KIX02314.1 hypothetical protein Z518_08255 [Rhinocladiella mackenziei CBS 650.93]
MSNEQEQPLIPRDHHDESEFSTQRRPQHPWIRRLLDFLSSDSPEHGEEDEHSSRPPSTSPRLWRLFGLFVILFLLIISFISGYQVAKRNHRHQPGKTQPPVVELELDQDQHWQTCGSTPSDALARGCSFDTLSFAWQTPECYDAELMAEWESTVRTNGWKYYADITGKRPVSYEAAFGGTNDLWVEWDLHVTHCTFMWRQMHRAFTQKGFIDSHLNSYNHTLHCQSVLTEEHDSWLADTAARVRYPRCERVGA